ncbi:MAG: hypothetical protein WB723_14055 [Candidatus Acidiferrales bacterium]
MKIAQGRDCQAEKPKRNDYQTSVTLSPAQFHGPEPQRADKTKNDNGASLGNGAALEPDDESHSSE